MASSDSTRVIIAGGGVAGLEAMLALRDLAEDRVDLTLIAPEPDFVYKAQLVEEPFDHGPAEHHELAPIAEEQGARFLMKALASVQPQDHTIELDDGAKLEYDKLIVCVGGHFRPALESGVTFPGPEPLDINQVIDQAATDFAGRIAFVVPPGVSWALPIYEVAMMTERRARERGVDVQLSVITPESAPLVIFGPAASAEVSALLKGRKISVETGAYAHDQDGGLILTPGDRPVEPSAIVALPALEGPDIPGLPSDAGGFMPIDDHARVVGVEDVYAAGDGTNFPIKQGGLGTQEADAAACHIAAQAGVEIDPEPFHPILRGKLLTGDESLSLRKDVTGKAGDGFASADRLWWPPHKVSGRYLTRVLGENEPHGEALPEPKTVDIHITMPQDWHKDPMRLDPYSPIQPG